jgi:hypothetical protein
MIRRFRKFKRFWNKLKKPFVSMIRTLALFAIATIAWSQPQNKPIRRPPNNQLALEGPDAPVGRVDAPAAVAGTTAGLVFHVSPLSNKGLLSQQIEDAIKALDKANGGATFLKLRAFVAGAGDLRRVQTIVNGFLGRCWVHQNFLRFYSFFIRCGDFPWHAAKALP